MLLVNSKLRKILYYLENQISNEFLPLSVVYSLRMDSMKSMFSKKFVLLIRFY